MLKSHDYESTRFDFKKHNCRVTPHFLALR